MNDLSAPWIDWLNTATGVLLFGLGLLCLLSQRSVIKQVIGLKIMLQGVTLNLINAAQLHAATATGEAMVISALVVEAVVIALALALIVNVFRHTPSGDVDRLNRLRG